ncbi:MAG TPA: alpha/beta fold hydrolase [Pirellulales bacterium]|jgi:pimeloyl-ACP methyl ester carboxylesterase|nr:alpha/beta fold hydrolase [Pirellulales bacterium]
MKFEVCRFVRLLGIALVWAWVLAVGSAAVRAQESEDDKDKIPPPVDLMLTTGDQVGIQCTYFGGMHKKESVPVILLHQFNGNRHDWDDLALYLQKTYGFALIAPDLRGHGNSTSQGARKLLASSMPLDQYPLMVQRDLDAVKQHLMQRNNNGELNINKLTVVGAEMGAIVGLLWTQSDWSWPVLTTGKQGQDVRALAMISPPFVFKNLKLTELAQNGPVQMAVRRDISVYIAVGKSDSKALSDAKRIYSLFENYHKAAMAKAETTDLFFDAMSTKLQGDKLIEEKSLKLGERIGEFIDVRVANQSFPWSER